MKFDFNNYKGKYAMHCKTKEEAEDFCRVMHEDGRMWRSGTSYAEDVKFFNIEETVYCFNEGVRDVGYAAKVKGYTILNWEDFMEKEFTKADLKDGMVGIARDGSKYIYLNERFMDENGSEMLCFPEEINDDLTIQFEYGNGYDIMRICKSSAEILNDYFEDENLETIWQRPEEVTEMTIAEIKTALGIAGTLKIKEENQ